MIFFNLNNKFRISVFLQINPAYSIIYIFVSIRPIRNLPNMVTIGGNKTLKCSLCDKRFANQSTLKLHERTHTGERPFSCSQCDYKCAQLGNLKQHERIHTGDKPYSCSQCDYKCSTSGALRTHEKTHTGYKPKCAQSITRHSLKQII